MRTSQSGRPFAWTSFYLALLLFVQTSQGQIETLDVGGPDEASFMDDPASDPMWKSWGFGMQPRVFRRLGFDRETSQRLFEYTQVSVAEASAVLSEGADLVCANRERIETHEELSDALDAMSSRWKAYIRSALTGIFELVDEDDREKLLSLRGGATIPRVQTTTISVPTPEVPPEDRMPVAQALAHMCTPHTEPPVPTPDPVRGLSEAHAP